FAEQIDPDGARAKRVIPPCYLHGGPMRRPDRHDDAAHPSPHGVAAVIGGSGADQSALSRPHPLGRKGPKMTGESSGRVMAYNLLGVNVGEGEYLVVHGPPAPKELGFP